MEAPPLALSPEVASVQIPPPPRKSLPLAAPHPEGIKKPPPRGFPSLSSQFLLAPSRSALLRVIIYYFINKLFIIY